MLYSSERSRIHVVFLVVNPDGALVGLSGCVSGDQFLSENRSCIAISGQGMTNIQLVLLLGKALNVTCVPFA